MFDFLRFRLFRRPPIATIGQHERVIADVVELFRMPIEDELCAPESESAALASTQPAAAPVDAVRSQVQARA